MKKRTVSGILAATLVLVTAMTAFASGNSIVMFGDTVQRTHTNSFIDKYPWNPEAILGSPATGGLNIDLGSASQAIGAGNVMFYPVSDFNGITVPNENTSYMTIWNMGSWSWDSSTSQSEPQMTNAVPIPDISNSSPVYDPSTGKAYLAAGGTFYAFDQYGNYTSVSISTSTPIDQNQVVSYPLYVTSAQDGTPTDEIWVSSQNGYLYAIDPANLSIVQKVYLGQRLDASPSLVTATDGTPYIAVTAAYNPNNKPITIGGTSYSGTGFLFLINPRDGTVTATVPDPAGPVASVASPVAISKGQIAWNDINANYFSGTVNPNGTVAIDQYKYNIAGDGQTSYYSESGYSTAANQYIIPLTDGGKYGVVAIDPSTNAVSGISVAGSSGPITAEGSPEISVGDGNGNDNLYIADTAGGIDEINANPTTHQFDSSSGGGFLRSKSGVGTTLSTPSELMMGTKSGTTAPTLTLATSSGLELWVNGGEYLTFGSSYTSSSPTQFSQPLTLTVTSGNLPSDPGNSDKIAFDMIVNGGTQMDAVGSGVATYDASGNPLATIPVSTSMLNSMLQTYETAYPTAWNNNAQNNVIIRAYSPSTNAENYVFQGTTASPDGSSAQVAVVFPAPNAVPATPPSNPAVGCVTVNNVSCSSALPGYTEWRFLSPGMLNTNEGQVFAGLGTAYKLHPIPEQAINSSPAAQYTTYYTYQDNPDGHTNPSNDVQPANWLNNFTIEFVGASGMAVNFDVQGKIATTGDMEFEKTYIGAWQPHWSQSCSLFGCWWVWGGYTPIYNHEYLYRNVGINETTNNDTLVVQKNATVWWNPSTINVTASGTFSSEDTPITPAGSAMTWAQPVWASYGGWIPNGSTAGTDFSQVPVTPGLNNTNTYGLTPNSMLPGTPSDDTPANAPAPDTLSGTWYSDSIMPAPPAGGDFSPQGTPVSHPFDTEHNGGVIFEPNAAHSDYPQLGAGTWWLNPTYTITSGSTTFEHSQISTWIPTWSKPWYNDSGQGVVSTETSTVKWNS